MMATTQCVKASLDIVSLWSPTEWAETGTHFCGDVKSPQVAPLLVGPEIPVA